MPSPNQIVKRGEIWTVAGPSAYAGKPRSALVIQDDHFDATRSVTICAFTTDPTEARLFRILVQPSEENGLRATSRLMVDKITTIPKDRLGSLLGHLADEDIVRLHQAIVVFLGLAGSSRPRR